jgi:hypothetical protein
LDNGEISGTYTFDVTDGDGNALDSGTGKFTGTRVSASG